MCWYTAQWLVSALNWWSQCMPTPATPVNGESREHLSPLTGRLQDISLSPNPYSVQSKGVVMPLVRLPKLTWSWKVVK